MKKPRIFYSPLPSWEFCRRSSYAPAVQQYQPNCLTPSAVCYDEAAAAALLCDSRAWCFCVYACALLYVWVGYVLPQAHKTLLKSGAVDFFLAKEAAQPRRHKSSIHSTLDSSSTVAAVQRQPRFCRLCASSRGVCACGWRTAGD